MSLAFDHNKSFDENLAEFRKHLETLDPECTAILFRHLAKLQGDNDQAPSRVDRTTFNLAALKDIDALKEERPA